MQGLYQDLCPYFPGVLPLDFLGQKMHSDVLKEKQKDGSEVEDGSDEISLCNMLKKPEVLLINRNVHNKLK